jgi:hypothetical protein
VRKYITPDSVRIYGLPGIDDSFGVRDNGSGQIWSASKRIGSINYWTGDVVLEKKCVPKVSFLDALLILLGVKSAALPNVSCEYEVSDLNAEAITGPRTTRSEIFPPGGDPSLSHKITAAIFVEARYRSSRFRETFPDRYP